MTACLIIELQRLFATRGCQTSERIRWPGVFCGSSFHDNTEGYEQQLAVLMPIMEDVDRGLPQWLDIAVTSVGHAPDHGHTSSLSNARAKRRLHGPNLRKNCGVNKHLLADAAQTTAALVSVRCGFHGRVVTQFPHVISVCMVAVVWDACGL